MSYVTPGTKKKVKFETKKKVDKHIQYAIEGFKDDLDKLNTKKQKIQTKLKIINDSVEKFIEEHPKEKKTIPTGGEIRAFGPKEMVNISKMVEIAKRLSDPVTVSLMKVGIKKLREKHNECKKEIAELENEVNEVSKKIKAMKKLLEK